MVCHGHGLINDQRVESLDEEVPLEDSEGVFAPSEILQENSQTKVCQI